MKNNWLVSGIFILMILALRINTVKAGGCCYKYFTSVDGIASVLDAQVRVAFVDPVSFGPLNSQKIEAHVASAKPGQFCVTNTQKTDADGGIAVHCSSPFPGIMSIYFTAPDMDAQANDSIKFYPKTVNFAANPNAPAATNTPTPTALHMPSVTPSSTPMPKETQQMVPVIAPETEQLQQRIDSLEKKIEAQEKQLNILQKAVNSIVTFFSQLFQ